jgi:hypothetical protein
MSQPAVQTTFSPAFQPEMESSQLASQQFQSAAEKAEEARRIRRLQTLIDMVTELIERDRSIPVEQASGLVANARRAALAMFPDKALAFDLLYWPRLQRMMRERYRMQ